MSDDDFAILAFCSRWPSCRVVLEGRESSVLAGSNSASLIRIIIRSFSTLVMKHYPRSFTRIRAHLGEGLFDVVV
jgi:hypothetical protein